MTESNSTNAGGNQDLASAICRSWMTKNNDFSNDEKVTSALKDKWDQVVGPLLVATTSSDSVDKKKDSTRWWNRIVNLHSDSDRAYHTLSHLHEMMGYLDLLFGQSPHDAAMVLSVFFHDVIYNAKSGANEEDSAKLMQEFFGDMEIKEEELEKRIVGYILATKSHKLPEDVDDPNLALFLDIDMAVLGKVESAYLHYAGLIRKEYVFVDRDMYCQKRADILEKFLEEPSIFASAIFKSAMEEQARKNVQKEIYLLRTGNIPGTSTR